MSPTALLLPPTTSSPPAMHGPIQSTESLCTALSHYPEIATTIYSYWEEQEGKVWEFKAMLGRVEEIIDAAVEAAVGDPELEKWGAVLTEKEIEEIVDIVFDILDGSRNSGTYVLSCALRLVAHAFTHFELLLLDVRRFLMILINTKVVPVLQAHPSLSSLRGTKHPFLVFSTADNFADASKECHTSENSQCYLFLQALGGYNMSSLPGLHKARDTKSNGCWVLWVLPWENFVAHPTHWHPMPTELLVDDRYPTRTTFGHLVYQEDHPTKEWDVRYETILWEEQLLSQPEQHGLMWMT